MKPTLSRALVQAAALLGRAQILAYARLSSARGHLAEHAALRERIRRLEEENDLLRARLQRISVFSRPRYKPWERFRILFHRARYGISLRRTAGIFVLQPSTLRSWVRDLQARKPRLARPPRPLNALPALVREIVWQLKREQVHWGTKRIALVLARLGLKGSRSSVQRILRRRPPRMPAPAVGNKSLRSLKAKYPNSHKGVQIRKAIEAVGARVVFLPPYSPDFNPIEMVFSKLKALLRKAKERSIDALNDRLGELMDHFPPDACERYFRHCGYAPR